MMKKLTSIGLVCAMFMALMSVSVAAAAEGEVPQAANSVSGSTASGAHEVVIEVASSVFDSLVITSVEYSVFRRLSPLRSFR